MFCPIYIYIIHSCIDKYMYKYTHIMHVYTTSITFYKIIKYIFYVLLNRVYFGYKNKSWYLGYCYFQLMLKTRYWNIIMFGSFFISFAVYFASTVVYTILVWWVFTLCRQWCTLFSCGECLLCVDSGVHYSSVVSVYFVSTVVYTILVWWVFTLCRQCCTLF